MNISMKCQRTLKITFCIYIYNGRTLVKVNNTEMLVFVPDDPGSNHGEVVICSLNVRRQLIPLEEKKCTQLLEGVASSDPLAALQVEHWTSSASIVITISSIVMLCYSLL